MLAEITIAQVEAALGSVAALRCAHAVCYGVALPGLDGKAGMACVV